MNRIVWYAILCLSALVSISVLGMCVYTLFNLVLR